MTGPEGEIELPTAVQFRGREPRAARAEVVGEDSKSVQLEPTEDGKQLRQRVRRSVESGEATRSFMSGGIFRIKKARMEHALRDIGAVGRFG